MRRLSSGTDPYPGGGAGFHCGAWRNRSLPPRSWVIFVYFLPRIVDYGEVWAAIRAMTWLELLTLASLAVWNKATYWLVEMSARPGLGYRQAMKITQASTAVSNTLPVGRRWGPVCRSPCTSPMGSPVRTSRSPWL
jgi:hypothetical protein